MPAICPLIKLFFQISAFFPCFFLFPVYILNCVTKFWEQRAKNYKVDFESVSNIALAAPVIFVPFLV